MGCGRSSAETNFDENSAKFYLVRLYVPTPMVRYRSRYLCSKEMDTHPQSPRRPVMMASIALVALLALLSYLLFAAYRKSDQHPVLPPPGPKPWPLLGNITDLRRKELWLLASEWAKRYGPFLPIFILFNLFNSS